MRSHAHMMCAILTLLISVFMVACGQPVAVDDLQRLQVTAPQSATRGSNVQVTVQAQAIAENSRVGLVMVGVHGTRVYSGVVQNGQVQFTIPAQHTQFIGYAALIATVGTIHGEASMIFVAGDDSA